MKAIRFLIASTVLCFSLSAVGASVTIDVDCNKPTAPLSPQLYGLFFEDITFAADGGLYAELLPNRSFEYYSVRGNDRLGRSYHLLYAWSKVERAGAACEIAVEKESPLNGKNTHYLKIQINQAGVAGVANSGFDGIPVDAGSNYDVSLYARNAC
jgi:hypothetical protein